MKKNAKYLILAAAAVLVLVPGLASSLTAILTNTPQSCEQTPFDPDCYCPSGDRKISVPWIGVPRWSCETVAELLIDPDSPTFETDSVQFVQAYLAQNCGEIYTDVCGGRFCGCPEDNPQCGAFASSHPIYPNQACISPAWGWGVQGARVVNVECVLIEEWNTPQGVMTHEEAIAVYGNQPNDEIEPESGTLPWRMEFFVESKTDTPTVQEVYVQNNYVYNEVLEQKCTHQSICDYYASIPDPSQWMIDHPGWCVGNLPLNVVPTDYPMSILGGFAITGLGSGYPAPVG